MVLFSPSMFICMRIEVYLSIEFPSNVQVVPKVSDLFKENGEPISHVCINII